MLRQPPQLFVESWLPAVAAHIDAPPDNGDILLDQPCALTTIAGAVHWKRDAPGRGDNTVPGQRRRSKAHGATDLTRATRCAGKLRNLPVTRDLAAGDAAYDLPGALIKLRKIIAGLALIGRSFGSRHAQPNSLRTGDVSALTLQCRELAALFALEAT